MVDNQTAVGQTFKEKRKKQIPGSGTVEFQS
jgi:hypothetical protein